MTRSAVWTVSMAAVLATAGCGQSTPSGTPQASDGPVAGSTEWFWANYSTADWQNVVPAEATDELLPLFEFQRLCRFIDRYHPGVQEPIELFCDAGGVVYDRQGNTLRFSTECWKWCHQFIADIEAKGGSMQLRASQQEVFDFADGHGDVPRWAYSIRSGPLMTLRFEMNLSLDGFSRG